MGKILSVGLDPALLQTRNLVLKRTGAEVVSAVVEQAMMMLESRHFDVVVICHTLSKNDKRCICRLVELFWPNSRMLLISKLAGTEISLCSLDVTFPWRLGPSALVELARQLLTEADAHPAQRTSAYSLLSRSAQSPKRGQAFQN